MYPTHHSESTFSLSLPLLKLSYLHSRSSLLYLLSLRDIWREEESGFDERG